MANEGAVAQPALLPSSTHTAAMECVYGNVTGHFMWSPKYVKHFLNIQCRDKSPSESFKEYMEKQKGSSFDHDEWRTLTKDYGRIFEDKTSFDSMDITTLGRLFECLFKVKPSHGNPWKMLAKLSKLRILRNKTMHNFAVMMDPKHLLELESELHSFISEAGIFYELSNDEINNLQDQLKIDRTVQFDHGKMQEYYICASVVREGRSRVEEFLQHNFTAENLMFGLGRVDKLAVFQELDALLRDKKRKRLNCKRILENSEQFIIMSGVAGAGKSTLLENIALQLSQDLSGASTGLEDFDLLVYIECRDRYTKSLSEVIVQFFPDMCDAHGKDAVREALRRVRVVFLIDGYDEYSPSMTVLQEVINMSRNSICRVIITTRPHAVDKLQKLLTRTEFVEIQIAPLAGIKQQTDLLSKYEPYLPGSQKKGSLVRSFKTMKTTLRSLFTEPLKLIQFCNVFVSFPDKIHKWKTPYDAAEDFFLVYKTLVEKRLIPASYSNLSTVIDNIFQVIGQAALDYLCSNTLIFKEDHIGQIQRQCLSVLSEKHNIKDLDMESVLSSILKMKRPLCRQSVATYSFCHKTDQEYFASRYVIRQIKTSNDLNQVLLGSKLAQTASSGSAETMGAKPLEPRLLLQRLREVLQFVVKDLNSTDEELLESRWPQLSQALKEAGLDSHKDWQDYMLGCPDVPLVVREAASLTLSWNSQWMIQNSRDVAVVAALLQYAQPHTLTVRAKLGDLRAENWKHVIERTKGVLSLHVFSTAADLLPPCDKILAPLVQCRGRLGSFRGCVSSDDGVAYLASVATAETELDITLKGPIHLSSLDGKCKKISVKTWPFPIADGARAPLPSQPPPELTVVNAPAGSSQKVARVLQTFAPSGNRYGRLDLKHGQLSPVELDELVSALHQLNIRTSGPGSARWEPKGNNECRLYICDKLPTNPKREEAPPET